MKGITCCAECAYYRMKTHKCSRGANKEPNLQNGDDVRFFADCPLDDYSPQKAKWLDTNSELMPTHKPDANHDSVFFATCSKCGITYNQLGVKHGWRYCPGCGYPMEGIYTEEAE